MVALLKYLGKGALTIVLLPFIVLYFAILIICQLLQFFIYGTVGIIKFFRGKTLKMKMKLLKNIKKSLENQELFQIQ